VCIQKITQPIATIHLTHKDEPKEKRYLSALQLCLALSRIYFRPLIKIKPPLSFKGITY
jgi:hypothetical protein